MNIQLASTQLTNQDQWDINDLILIANTSNAECLVFSGYSLDIDEIETFNHSLTNHQTLIVLNVFGDNSDKYHDIGSIYICHNNSGLKKVREQQFIRSRDFQFGIKNHRPDFTQFINELRDNTYNLKGVKICFLCCGEVLFLKSKKNGGIEYQGKALEKADPLKSIDSCDVIIDISHTVFGWSNSYINRYKRLSSYGKTFILTTNSEYHKRLDQIKNLQKVYHNSIELKLSDVLVNEDYIVREVNIPIVSKSLIQTINNIQLNGIHS